MVLYKNGKPEEFLLFVWNLNMTLDSLGILAANANPQYLRTLLYGEALCQFDTLCSQVRITTLAPLN